MYEYYWYGEICCVVGTTNSYDTYEEMESDYGKENLKEVDCPNNVSDDMLVW